jgi:hypothetical protein
MLIPKAGILVPVPTQTRQVSHHGHGHSPIVQLSLASMLAPEIKIVRELLIAIRNLPGIDPFAAAD